MKKPNANSKEYCLRKMCHIFRMFMFNNEKAKYRVLIGAVILGLSQTFPWFYGNFATYQFSYLKYHFKQENVYEEMVWILPIYMAHIVIGTSTTDFVIRLTSIRMALYIGIFLEWCGLLLSYIAMQHSVSALMVLLSSVYGYGQGLKMGLSYCYPSLHFDKSVGIATSLIVASNGAGGLIANAVITFYMNPDNVAADVHEGNLSYFSNPDIHMRFPILIFIIFVMTIIPEIIAIIFINLLSEHPTKQAGKTSIKSKPDATTIIPSKTLAPQNLSISPSDIEMTISTNSDVSIYNNKYEKCTSILRQSFGDSGSNSDEQTSKQNYGTVLDLTLMSNGKKIKLTPSSSKMCNGIKNDSSANVSSSTNHLDIDPEKSILAPSRQALLPDDHNKRPCEVLQSIYFYALWFNNLSLVASMMTTLSSYKLYSQLWIHDDNFLALVGVINCIAVFVFRASFGFVVDRIGVEKTIILVLSINSVFLVFWSFTIRIDKWLFLIWTAIIVGVQSTSLTVTPIAMLKYFGGKYYITNAGLLLTSLLIIALVLPPVMSVCMTQFGWVFLFQVMSALSTLALVFYIIVVMRLAYQGQIVPPSSSP